MQEPQADTKRLPTIIDEQGAPVDLAVCMAEERTSLCQASCSGILVQIFNTLPSAPAVLLCLDTHIGAH